MAGEDPALAGESPSVCSRSEPVPSLGGQSITHDTSRTRRACLTADIWHDVNSLSQVPGRIQDILFWVHIYVRTVACVFMWEWAKPITPFTCLHEGACGPGSHGVTITGSKVCSSCLNLSCSNADVHTDHLAFCQDAERDSVCLLWVPRFCISNGLPGGEAAAGHRSAFGWSGFVRGLCVRPL